VQPELVLAVVVAIGLAFAAGLMIARVPSAAQRTQASAPSAEADYSDRLEPADQLRIGLIVFDARDRVAAANASAAELLRASSVGMLGKSPMEAFVDHNAEQLLRAARRDGRASTELTIGGEPSRTLRLDAWLGPSGTLQVALQDYSELRRLQRIRTEFIGNLSHELRTPLTTIRLLTESLMLEADRARVPTRMRESIGKIDVETGHLVQMVNELLDLATIEHGDAPLRTDEVDLAALVENTVGRLRTFAERQGVTLRDEIAAPRLEHVVNGDEERLGQAVANIVHNAIKFSSPSDEVVVHLRAEPEKVVVEVEDHGPGIPRADRSRIFERFYKVDRARSRGRGGTGLGLSIARHIIERHGGRIWVESEEGAGSRFFVSLPRAGRAG
jgi:two-component system, OmpR family, phosphate regulon sensor histidine kinase PhoR